MAVLQHVGGQGGPGEEPQQDRSGACDGQVGPLALGLDAQVGSHLLKGNFQLPAQHKPLQYPGRVLRRVGAEQGLRGEGALGVSDQHPANGYRGLAGAVPDCRLGGELHRACGAVIPGHRGAGPGCLGLVKESFERGLPRAFEWRATVLSRLTGWRWSIEAASMRKRAIRVTGSRRDWKMMFFIVGKFVVDRWRPVYSSRDFHPQQGTKNQQCSGYGTRRIDPIWSIRQGSDDSEDSR